MEDEQYYIRDIESGFKHRVTREQYEAYQKMIEHFNTPINPNQYKGKVIITGTTGDFTACDNFENMFHNPQDD